MINKLINDIIYRYQEKLATWTKLAEENISENATPDADRQGIPVTTMSLNPLDDYLTPEIEEKINQRNEVIKRLDRYGDWRAPGFEYRDEIQNLPENELLALRNDLSEEFSLLRDITVRGENSSYAPLLAKEIKEHPELAENLKKWLRAGYTMDNIRPEYIKEEPSDYDQAWGPVYAKNKGRSNKKPYSGPILSDNNKSNPMFNADNNFRFQYFNNLAKAMNAEKFFYNMTLPDSSLEMITEDGRRGYRHKKSPAGLHGLPVNIPENLVHKITELAGGGSIMPNPYRGKMPRFDPDTDPRMHDSLLKRMGETFPNIGDIKSKEIKSYEKGLRRALNNPRNSMWPHSLLFGKPVHSLLGLSDNVTGRKEINYGDPDNLVPELIADAKKRYRETKHNKYVDKDRFYSVPDQLPSYPASGLLSKLLTPSNAIIGKDATGITRAFNPEDFMMFRPPSDLGADSTALNNPEKWKKLQKMDAIKYKPVIKNKNTKDEEA